MRLAWRFVISLLIPAVLSCVPSSALAQGKNDNPVANPKAIVQKNDVRFTVLTPQLIRMEWSKDRQFEDHASLVFINRDLPVPNYTVRNEHGWTVIQTDALVLKYKNRSGKFSAQNLSVTLQLSGKPVVWKPGTPDKGNLGGTTRTLDGINGANTKIGPGLVSRNGWVVVDDGNRPLFDNSDWPWVMLRPAGERQDLYFFGYGHNYKQALADYTKVAGKIPLPPRFVFGTWWSRYWPYTDQELIQLVNDFKAHDVPLDVLVIDMDWHNTFDNAWAKGEKDASGHPLGWTGYTWNHEYFPDPKKFLTWVHDQGLKATVNMHPASGVQPWEDAYPEFARAMGIDPATKQYVKFDIANKKFAENYFKLLHYPLEKQGIDFFWLDWQQEHHTSVPGLNPTFWLNYTHTSDMERRGKRPLIYHRWGGLGNHRYEIGFSGDTYSTWDSLAFQPYFTSTASNVGYGYWSHDIGGHMPGKVDPELYTRWVQFGAFSPILRTHTTKNPEAERRIWAYPLPYANAMRNAFILRYAMIPYIYTASREAYDTGISLLRPMYYDYPEAPEAYDAKDQYMFGDSILVAPIAKPMDPVYKVTKQSIWLPEGEWIEWFTGAHLKGPGTFERSFTLDQIPAYVKAGAIIPMQPKMNRSDERPVDPLILKIFPGTKGSARLYEDEGNSLGYKHNRFAWTKITYSNSGRTANIEVAPAEGSYPGMPGERGYELQLVQTFPPESVTVNGTNVPYDDTGKQALGWHYDGANLTTIINVPRTSVRAAVSVSVQTGAEQAANVNLLDGIPGRFVHMRRAMDIINTEAYPSWSPDSLIHAVQTSRRIELNPTSALDELRAFRASQNKIESDIRAVKMSPAVLDRALMNVTPDARSAAAAQ
jgi:alpha-glucosidase (family GH31 glycosyl hydrolase)